MVLLAGISGIVFKSAAAVAKHAAVKSIMRRGAEETRAPIEPPRNSAP
jgi:hypothetical protein